MKNNLKRILALILAFMMVAGSLLIVIQSCTVNAANASVIYSEDFSYDNINTTSGVLDSLGWYVCDGLTKNSASLSIENGKLIFTNTDTSSVDSYFTILADDYMKDACGGDYSIQYTVKYTNAGSPTRYACLLYNYNSYMTYNSVHIRANGTGNNQSRINGAWTNYEAHSNERVSSLRNTNENALCKRLFGINYNADATPFVDLELTVRIAISKTKGPSVYVNGKLMSECVDATNLSLTDAFAVALKVSPKIKGELDNILIWKGLGEVPADKTVGYTPTPAEAKYKFVSLNLLYDSPSARFNYIKSFFAKEKPDVVGLQEINSGFDSLFSYLGKPENGSYKITDRYLTGTTTFNMAPILYDSDRFELVEGTLAHGAHLLEARWQKTKSKIISWAILRDRTTGRRILAMNTHFAVYTSSYTGVTAADAVAWRIENAKYAIELLDKIRAEHGALPTFFTGDFNMQNHETAHRILLQRFTDSQLFAPDAVNFMASYNNMFSEKKHVTSEKYPIDHIYISEGDWNVTSHRIVRDDTTAVMTDHYPVVAEMTLSKVTAPVCSHVSGMYSGKQTVKLTADRTSGAEILYTTDGSDPKVNGRVYTAPFSVSGNVRLRAVTRYFGRFSNETDVRFRDKNSPELLITSVTQNSPGTDVIEGFQLINISKNAVDLADYKLFSETKTSKTELDAVKIGDMEKNIQLSNVKGKYILQPGQTAFIWIIFSDVYTSGKGLVTKGQNGAPSYNIDIFKAVYKEQTNNSIPESTLIVPLDRTTGSYFRNNSTTSLVNSFNMANSAAARFCLTYTNATSAVDAICTVEMYDGGSTGSYVFTQNANTQKLTSVYKKNEYNYGMYYSDQHTALKAMMESVPSYFDSLLIGRTVETQPQVTTKAPETTTAPVTTKAPETTRTPDMTKVPDTTKAPETTKVPETTEKPSVTTDAVTAEPKESTPSPESTKKEQTTAAPSVTDEPTDTSAKAESGTHDIQTVILPEKEVNTPISTIIVIVSLVIAVCIAVMIFLVKKFKI